MIAFGYILNVNYDVLQEDVTCVQLILVQIKYSE